MIHTTTDAPRTDPSLFRYKGIGPFDDDAPPDMPDDDSDFGLRLPRHPAAPSTESSMPKQPPTENDIAEVIRLLQEAKTEREKAVTKGNLEDLATTVMGGIREVETKLTARIDTVEGHVRVHALAIRAIDERTGGSNSNMINVRASSAPRRMSPMPQAISVEQTAGGGIRIQDGAQFDKLCKRLDDQEKTIAEITEREVAAQERERVAEEGKRIAQIRQGAVQEYADKLEAKNKKERRLYKRLAMGAAVPVLAAVVHLVQAYVQERVVDKPHHVTVETPSRQ